MNEAKIEINVKKEDIMEYNLYLASCKKQYSILFCATILLGIGIYFLVRDIITNMYLDLPINIMFILVGLIGILYTTVFIKILIKRKIKKQSFSDLPTIDVSLSSEGILYKFKDEDKEDANKIYPYRYEEVLKVTETSSHIYIHLIDHQTVLLITKNTTDIKNFIEVLKQSIPQNKYKVKK